MQARTLWAASSLAAALLLATGPVAAKTFNLTGVVTSCTPTCNSFAFLGTGSTIDGFLEMDDAAIADGAWVGADVTELSFTVGDPALPPFGPSDPPDPVVDNPFVLDQTAERGGLIVAAGEPITNPRGTWPVCNPGQISGCVQNSAGTTDGNTLTGGFMDIWVTTTVLAANGAVIHIDFTAGTFTVNIFENLIFVAGGTIAPVVSDTDGDGLNDDADNCTNVANNGQPGTGPAQNDTDGDGIGNMCDADFDDNCSVNFSDLGEMKAVFFQSGVLEEDMDGSGSVNFADLGLLKAGFFLPPGPSGVPNICSP